MQRWRGPLRLLTALFLLLALGTFTTARALHFAGGQRFVVGPNEVVPDDVYAVAQDVIVQGTIKGDLYAVARHITIAPGARITGDLVVAGQVVDVRGVVEDDVRAAGYLIHVASPRVGDDVIAAAFSVDIPEGSVVGGSLVAGSYQVRVAGTVQEGVLAAANGILIQGNVGGDVTAIVGERGGMPLTYGAFFVDTGGVSVPPVPSGLTVGPGARVEGNLVYQAVQEATIAPTARVVGRVVHRLPPQPTKATHPPAFGTLPWVAQQARRLFTYLVVGMALFLGAGTTARRFGSVVVQRPLAALGWGIVTVAVVIATLVLLLLVTVVVALILGLLTLSTLARWALVVGLAADVLLLIAYLAYVGLLVPALVSYASLSFFDRGRWLWALPLVLGLVLYVVLTSLPYVGWIVSLVVILVGLGGAVLLYRHHPEPGEQHA